MVGRIFSHYKILDKLGEGGMGVVYKAEDTRLKRPVALKFLPPDLIRDEEAKERFICEAQTASALDHQNICTIHEIDESDGGGIFIAMAYYEGETLKAQVASCKLQVNTIVDIAIQIAQGLAKAHEKGVIHRDIKPSNIIVQDDGTIKIIDFGLSKLLGVSDMTKNAAIMGTTAYMSPEQLQGEKVDERTDIWSFGVVLYEMLTGQLPFAGEVQQAVVYSILAKQHRPVTDFRKDIPLELQQIVERALEKEPDDRYHHLDEVLHDLHAITESSQPGKFKTNSISERHRKKRRAMLYGIYTIVLVLLIAGSFYFVPEDDRTIDSIAVLPLKNLSGDPGQEYIADGMTEALISNLAKISVLRVISRTSVMRYKKSDKSLPEIAHELNVDVIIEGSVLQTEGSVRISVQAIETTTDRHLWADSYERDLSNIRGLQGEIWQTIARKIKITLTSEDEGRLADARPLNPQAYQAYLKGRYFWRKVTENDLRKSIKYFEEAIAKDSTFALAYAGLADAYATLGIPGISALPPRDIMPKARAAAEKAVELDDALSEAHAALGFVKLIYDWDWVDAEKEFRQAVALNPGNSMALFWYSVFLAVVGRHDEAIATCQRALDLDPFSLSINVALGNDLLMAGRFDQAIEQSRNTLEMYPNSWHPLRTLGIIYAQKSMFEEANAVLQKAVTLSGRGAWALATLGYAYAVDGKRDAAVQILGELKKESQQKYISSHTVALVYVGLGDKEHAFEWLEKAFQERAGSTIWLGVVPVYDSLRSDMRFNALLKKVGLVK